MCLPIVCNVCGCVSITYSACMGFVSLGQSPSFLLVLLLFFVRYGLHGLYTGTSHVSTSLNIIDRKVNMYSSTTVAFAFSKLGYLMSCSWERSIEKSVMLRRETDFLVPKTK